MRTHFPHLALIAACMAGIPTSALAQPSQVGSTSELMGKKKDLTIDLLDVAAQETPIVLAQADASGISTQPDYILKQCQEYEETGDPESAIHGINPAGLLRAYFNNYGNRDRVIDIPAIKTTLLETTKHGKLEQRTAPNGAIYYMYYSEPGYVGDDQASFMAEFEGKRYKIVVNIKVLKYVVAPAKPSQPA